MATTKQKQLFESAQGGPSAKTASSDIFAIGTVVDTNDPMQWGRVRVVVQSWGDSWGHQTDGMPWAMYVSPVGGQTSVGTRGAGIQQTEGGISYGMWAIPKVGAQVLVISLDEDHQQRLYLGCVFDAFTTNTMPHGRWMFEDHPELSNKPNAKPYGPYSASDKLIQPLAGNLKQAFNNKDGFEWQTRAADYSASRVDVSQLHNTTSNVQDDKSFDSKGWVSTQGYQTSRLDPHSKAGKTDKNYDSQVYSFTSPGFHSMSMDDRMENCRMRFRTMSGHQILLDDTNERIYIATAKGNNWIEMDQAGNIDMFTTNKVNIRAEQGINLTSDKEIRMYAKQGIHMHSDKDIRMHGTEDIHIQTSKNLRTRSGQSTLIQSDRNLNVTTSGDFKLFSTGATNISADGALLLTTAAAYNVNAGGNVLVTGTQIHLNGPVAAKAAKAVKAAELAALYTNRIPAHEPWARTMTKKDDGHDPEFAYGDKKVGRMERGKPIIRGLYWRR